ncbi:MAG: signal peptidase I [Actinomycetota bacterium]|nr:signal peptidase I [Actinomycetota bacterium]
MAAIGVWAVATERVSYVVTHGVSMNPVYYKGDLVVIVRRGSYQVGDIVAYRDERSGERVLHRIIGGDATNGFVFKGDNNQSIDFPRPTQGELVGKELFHIPHGGIWLKPLLSPAGLGMIMFLIVGGGTAAAKTRRQVPRGRRKKKVKAMPPQADSLARAAEVVQSIERMSAPARALAVLSAALAGLALGLGLVGWTVPVVERVAVPPGPAQTTTFSYSAKVGPTPAYDGTTVTSPDPIFRKLVERIDLRVRYEGPPGTFDLVAALSNGTGWRTTMTLVPAQEFTRTPYEKVVKLNLDALSKRAAAASEVIGTGAGNPLTIELTSHVLADAAPLFTATAQFGMDNVQFTVASKSSLSTSSDTSAGTALQARRIAVLGRDVMPVPTARLYAIVAFLTAMTVGAGVYFLIRRNNPARVRDAIERRHRHLLVHVAPITPAPGATVVHVDSFKALVKLAERYGQLILTWGGPDAVHFVVRDEGITYRYRLRLDEADERNADPIKRPNGAESHLRQ